MKAKKQTYILFLFLTFCCSNISFAQTEEAQERNTLPLEERTEMAKKAAVELRTGVLIVRLKTNSRKIEELERLINAEGVDENKKKRFETMVNSVRESTEKQNSIFIKAFKEHYDFSDVLFIFDTSASSLAEGKTEGIFLNNNLEHDPELKLGDRKYFITYFGKNPMNYTKSDVEGMVIMDKNNEVIVPPFPYFVHRLKSPYFLTKDYEEKYYSMVVKTLNKKLDRFVYQYRVDVP